MEGTFFFSVRPCRSVTQVRWELWKEADLDLPCYPNGLIIRGYPVEEQS
jgi:hypothetical protein